MSKTRKTSGQKNIKLTLYQWLSRIYVVLMLCVFPLYLHPDKYVSLTKHKANFFFVASIAYLFILGIVWLYENVGSAKHKAHKWKLKFSVADWAVLAFMAVSIISTLFSPFPEHVFLGLPERYDGLLTTLLYCAVYFALSRTYKLQQRDFLLFAASAMLISLIGILQYYGADIFSLFPYDLMPGFTAKTIIFRTTLGNIDIVSSYTSLTVLFFGILYIKGETKWRFFYLAAGALNVYLMVLGGAEAGIVGVLVAFVVAIPFLVSDYRTIYRTLFLGFAYALTAAIFTLTYALPAEASAFFASLLQSKLLLVAVGMLVAAALVYWIGPHIKLNWSKKTVRIIGAVLLMLVILTGFGSVEVIGRDTAQGSVYEAREILHGQLNDEFGTYRGFIWNRSIQLLQENTSVGQLLIGSGPDTFVDRFEPYFTEAVLKLDLNYDKAHNEYLQILFCQGLLGLLTYLVFLVALLIKAVPRAFEQPLLLAAVLSCVSYTIQAFFGISVPIATPLFWVILGIVALHCKNQKLSNQELDKLKI